MHFFSQATTYVFFFLDVQAPLFDSDDLLALALYDNTQFPMYEVREIPQSIKRCF